MVVYMIYIVLYHAVLCKFFNYCGTSLVSRLQQSGAVPHSKRIWDVLADGAGQRTRSATIAERICIQLYR